jgi:polyhydroxyalkanoate synthase
MDPSFASGILPDVRHGPRPLALYLAVASRLERQRGCEAGAILGPFVDGLKRYWRYPRRARTLSDEVVWSSGSARLLARGPVDGAPLLLIPSLVNRARVLDLLPGRSLIEALAAGGCRTLLLDWGEPSPTELGFGLEDHVARRLEPALAEAWRLTGRRPVVLGYCMGGLLALALAARARRQMAGLALLATPWDFAAARNQQPLPPAVAASLLGGIVASHGHVPANMLDWSFGALDPAQVVTKYAAFSRSDATTLQARAFVAIEDWLADGVALAGPVARECLLDWYVANRPARGTWRVGGRPIRPDRLNLPTLVAVPSHDRIVPEASAMPLARALPGATILRPASGHVGMVVGSRARDELWRPLLHWLDRAADATA